MVVLRLTVHGAKQPQNSPHGWDRKTGTHECFDADYAYGCWAIVTPPWTVVRVRVTVTVRVRVRVGVRVRVRPLGDRHAALDGAPLPSNPLTLTL